jgi:nitrogen fixation protein NifU and related proteins
VSDLYERVLVDHARHPRNFGPLPRATASAEGINPLCGDEVTVRVRTEQARIGEIAFEGAGCAVCMGSASLMTESVKGLTLPEVSEMMQRIRALLRGEGDASKLGDLAALDGVARFPARVKCAALAWSALEAALWGAGNAVSTEL